MSTVYFCLFFFSYILFSCFKEICHKAISIFVGQFLLFFLCFVLTTRTTQPHPQVFSVNSSIIWQFCHTHDTNSSHICKILPNLVDIQGCCCQYMHTYLYFLPPLHRTRHFGFRPAQRHGFLLSRISHHPNSVSTFNVTCLVVSGDISVNPGPGSRYYISSCISDCRRSR